MRETSVSFVDSLMLAENAQLGSPNSEVRSKRLFSLIGWGRHRVRLRTQLAWTVFFSDVLTIAFIGFGVPTVGRFEWGISAAAVTSLVALVVREVCSRVKGNAFGEPSSRSFTYGWGIAVTVLVLFAFVFGERIDEYLVRQRPLVHLVSITLAAAFFLSSVAALGWLLIYERQHGPVYIVERQGLGPRSDTRG